MVSTSVFKRLGRLTFAALLGSAISSAALESAMAQQAGGINVGPDAVKMVSVDNQQKRSAW